MNRRLEENQYLLRLKIIVSNPKPSKVLSRPFHESERKTKGTGGEQSEWDLYPEGPIREIEFDQQGYALIDAFDDASTEEWGDVLPTGFALDFVVRRRWRRKTQGSGHETRGIHSRLWWAKRN